MTTSLLLTDKIFMFNLPVGTIKHEIIPITELKEALGNDYIGHFDEQVDARMDQAELLESIMAGVNEAAGTKLVASDFKMVEEEDGMSMTFVRPVILAPFDEKRPVVAIEYFYTLNPERENPDDPLMKISEVFTIHKLELIG